MEEDSADTMKILVATDIHLGYNENHPIRGNFVKNKSACSLTFLVLR